MKIEVPAKVVKRLFAAEGYLELGMPQQALRELDEIDHLEPIEASVQYLTGESLKAQERYERRDRTAAAGRPVDSGSL